MPYPWECIDCDFLDEDDMKWMKYYCPKRKRYVKANSASCSDFKKKAPYVPSCYLTTIMCEILGYEDDCDILNCLRNFRESFMRPNPKYQPLLEDYDIIGPLVCEKLNNDNNKVDMARLMLKEYIDPAIGFISLGENEMAIETYKNMTLDLMEYYGLEENLSMNKPVVRVR